MKIKLYYIPLAILFSLSSSCGSNQQASETGSISFNLGLSHPTVASLAAAASADICTDYGIMFINASVVKSAGKEVAGDYWSCQAHQGTIANVPAGTGYTIRISGTVSGGIIAWRGELGGVTVATGETTNAGIITMTYSGNNETPPAVIGTNPEDGAVSVPVTSGIMVVFSEQMAASSLNEETFTVRKGSIPVIGSISYDSVTAIATFNPTDPLSYFTEYSVLVSADVKDSAGIKMDSEIAWTFTTEDTPAGIPDAPSGVIAASGNGEITISWNAVVAAASYNIYWSDTPGVTKSEGTKISGITTASYSHAGLSNGTIYYYMVTSENSFDESSGSLEIASAPGAFDGSPPTGSIVINNNDSYTDSADVTLSLASSSTKGVSQMCISNTSTCSSWEPYTTSRLWPLTESDGVRTVFAWFKDSEGKETTPYGDDIILDTTPPTDGTLVVTAGDNEMSLSWSGFSDTTSGLKNYMLVYSTSNIPDSCSSGISIYSGSETSYIHSGLISGTSYYYRICAIDNAGNASAGAY